MLQLSSSPRASGYQLRSERAAKGVDSVLNVGTRLRLGADTNPNRAGTRSEYRRHEASYGAANRPVCKKTPSTRGGVLGATVRSRGGEKGRMWILQQGACHRR
jgi:hypothetical protein